MALKLLRVVARATRQKNKNLAKKKDSQVVTILLDHPYRDTDSDILILLIRQSIVVAVFVTNFAILEASDFDNGKNCSFFNYIF